MTENSSTLVARVKALIISIFEISDRDAQENAEGLVTLAEGWGGSGVSELDWAYQIKKKFGEKLKWKSQEVRKAYFSDQKTTLKAYEGYIQNRK